MVFRHGLELIKHWKTLMYLQEEKVQCWFAIFCGGMKIANLLLVAPGKILGQKGVGDRRILILTILVLKNKIF